MAEWYPIQPQLTEDGAFAALSALPDGERYVPTGASDPSRLQKVESQLVSMRGDVALKLGMVAAGGVRSTYEGLVIDYEIGRYYDRHGGGGPVFSTRWGVGLRLSLSVHQSDVSGELNLGALAAKGQLNLLRSSYSLSGFGIRTPDVLKLLPGPGRFDLESWEKIQAATKGVIALLEDDADKRPVPCWVRLARAPGADALDTAYAVHFAMDQIARGNTVPEAVRLATRRGADVGIVRRIYADRLGAPDVVSDDDRERAQAWLSTTQTD